MNKNIYTVIFNDVSETAVKADNKIEAINKAIFRLKGWRDKDRIEKIEVKEDVGNRELTHEDYQ